MSNTIKLPCEVGEVSDGFHTFNELYEHRCTLFIAFMQCRNNIAWMSRFHDDGSALEGWFICGINMPNATISYHLPDKMWKLASMSNCKILQRAPKWDGHTPNDVIARLTDWIKSGAITHE